MIKSKAIDIILKLNKTERQDLKDFLSSPYFNKKKKIIEMYDLILMNTKDIYKADISEENIFSSLFGKSGFSYSFIRNLMSELLNLCEMFLVINNLKVNSNSDSRFNKALLKEYNIRFLDSHFNIKLKKIKKDNSSKKIDSEYFDYLGKIESENIAYHLYRSEMDKVPAHLINRTEYNLCHILQLLEFDVSDLKVNAAAFNINFKNNLLSIFLDNVNIQNLITALENNDSPLKDEIEIRLRFILLSADKNNEDNFYELKKMFFRRIDNYSNIEKSNMYIKLKNFCALRIYEGDVKYYDEKYSLAKKEFETINYNTDGIGPLFPNIYLETIQKAVLEKDTEYAEYVVKNFTKEIEPAKQNSVSNLAKAFIEFENKNYEKTILLLSDVNNFNIFMKNSSKILYLKSFYEINSLETGLSMLDSFIHFINETKEITVNRKRLLKKNYDIMKKLYKLKLSAGNYSLFDIEKIRSEIKDSEIYYNGWYNEKLDELKENKFS